MSVLPIRLFGDPVLRRVTKHATPNDRTRRLAADMLETMYYAYGRGLAAPQVGHSLRLFVMDCHWKDGAEREPAVFLNPTITWRSVDDAVNEEGCLSIPGVPVNVRRAAAVVLSWTDLDGVPQQRTFDGFEAICVQHEVDHLDGVLNVDLVSVEDRARIAVQLEALAEK